MMVRITKEFSFEMAHQLEGYNGKCCHLHGHSYRLQVTLRGTPCDDPNSPTYGMVMDFSQLKEVVHRHVIDQLDHALLLRRGCPLDEALKNSCTKIVQVDYQPTCENMVVHIAETLRRELPQAASLHSLRLYETATSWAEWTISDLKI